jgi:hypothetical protein
VRLGFQFFGPPAVALGVDGGDAIVERFVSANINVYAAHWLTKHPNTARFGEWSAPFRLGPNHPASRARVAL